MIKKKRNYDSLDTFKCVAMFMVLILHGTMPEPYQSIACAVARVGVPFFFLISGFFAYTDLPKEEERAKRKKKVVRLTKLMLLLIVAYHFMWTIRVITGKITVADYFGGYGIGFWLLNIGYMSGHLWYIRSLIYMEILFLTPVGEILKSRKGTMISGALLLMDIICMKYSLLFFGRQLPEPYFESITKFFGTAIVYYTLGYHMAKRKDAITKRVRERSSFAHGVIIAILILANIAEFQILTRFQINAMPCNYVATFFLTIYLFVFALAYPDFGSGSVINRIGRKYSASIYYWHLLIVQLTAGIYRRLGIPDYISHNPFTILLESLLIIGMVFLLKDLKRGVTHD